MSYQADYAMPVGEFLAEELEAREMTTKALAAAMGCTAKVVNDIVDEKKSLTTDTALQLEAVLGITALTWLNMQAQYDLVQARARIAAS